MHSLTKLAQLNKDQYVDYHCHLLQHNSVFHVFKCVYAYVYMFNLHYFGHLGAAPQAVKTTQTYYHIFVLVVHKLGHVKRVCVHMLKASGGSFYLK